MPLGRHLTRCLVSCAALACSAGRDDGHARSAAIARAADTIALDSCAKLDRLAAPQLRVLQPGETIPAPHAGSWDNVKRLNLGIGTIDVPSSTTLGRTDSTFVAVVDFPTCRYFCDISITLVRDSVNRSLDDYVASFRAVDTTDPNDEPPGPPRPFRVGPDTGRMMEMPCGDCGGSDIVVKRGNTVAHIGYNLDDREGHQPGIECRLTRAAATFRWLDSKAAISVRQPGER